MPYSKHDKELTKGMVSIYKQLAKGEKPPYTDPELPHSLDEAAKLESNALEETANAVTQLIQNGGEQNKVAELISQASSAIDALDQIALIKRDSLGITKD